MPGIRPRTVVGAKRPASLDPKQLDRIETMKKKSAEEFRGVATSDGLAPGLYSVQPTGIPTDGIVAAANTYLDKLSPYEREIATLPLESDTWRQWANGGRNFLRHGLCLDDLSEVKRELALDVVRESFSPRGFSIARDIMRLNHALGVLSDYLEDFDEWYYWLSIYGEPSTTGAWGWQLDGHHLCLSCAFVGDQMVVTPQFIGAEPVYVDNGPYAGIRMFRDEESDALLFMQRLDESQRKLAVFSDEMPNDLFVGAFRDNFDLNYQGIEFGNLNEDQHKELFQLIELYTKRVRRGHSEKWMDQIREHADEMHFAWVGGTQSDSVFYYRIHSPVILIEFEHQHGVIYDHEEPRQMHVHTVVRTPNGNDYGKDILRQHHESQHNGR